MQSTGIVRRIDDLGRVVIPKEIRKTLRIKEGDPLEIYTNKEELVFKKFSPIATLSLGAKQIVEELSLALNRPCVICDTDKVLCVSKCKNKVYLDALISKDVQKILNDRKTFISNEMDGEKPIKIYIGDENEYANQLIVPIVSNGDCFGAVIVFDFEKDNRFNSSDEKLVKFSASFLSCQFEI